MKTSIDERLVGPVLPHADDALLYSRNYANSSPYLNHTAREHILGLCDLLEATHREATWLRAAIQDIADPVSAWLRDLRPDEILDGAAAARMAEDAQTYRMMAREALRPNAQDENR